MASSPFSKRIRAPLANVDKKTSTAKFREVVEALTETATAVEELLKEGNSSEVEVRVVPGHLVNQGREHRVVVRAPSHGLSDYLLRAYVPVGGYPVVVDAIDQDDVSYPTRAKLEEGLIKLVSSDWFGDRVVGLRELLRDPSMQQNATLVRAVGTKSSKSE